MRTTGTLPPQRPPHTNTVNETVFDQIFHRLYDNSPTCIFILKESVSIFETNFFFVLGGCVAWNFVFNSSLRIKRRKNPALLSA